MPRVHDAVGRYLWPATGPLKADQGVPRSIALDKVLGGGRFERQDQTLTSEVAGHRYARTVLGAEDEVMDNL